MEIAAVGAAAGAAAGAADALAQFCPVVLVLTVRLVVAVLVVAPFALRSDYLCKLNFAAVVVVAAVESVVPWPQSW